MRILNSLQNKHLFFILLFFSCTSLFSQKIVCGPVQGNTSDSSATFWLLTKKNSSLSIKTPSSSFIHSSEIKEDTFVNSSFKNFRAYTVTVFFNKHQKKQLPFSFVVDKNTYNHSILLSSKNDSSFFFGSCAYIGKGFSKIYRPWNKTKIFNTIAKDDRSKYMIWMGDNVYLILNHDLKNSFQIYKRYLGVRKQRNMNFLLSSRKQHYATWDDHDFGPNNCDGTFKNAHLTSSAFKSFWPNPKPVQEKGIHYTFTKGDVTFLMTDGRTFKRTNDTILLGRKQLGWIKKELIESTSTFKVIVMGNQLINKGHHESYYDFKRERAELISFINNHKIPGVLFFSGDRHHSEINVETHQNFYPIYDITCSALSSPRRLHLKRKEKNKQISTRIKNSFLVKHNYGLFRVINNNGGKSAEIKFLNKYGKTIYSYSISEKSLGY